jgi:glycosyltransferase involved in cell wall biosynthesis
LVYNHEPFLRQCLDGFVMQKTNFKFEAIVHDDCSTDGSADIIREYADKYPDIIKPIYEKENQYSKGN